MKYIDKRVEELYQAYLEAYYRFMDVEYDEELYQIQQEAATDFAEAFLINREQKDALK